MAKVLAKEHDVNCYNFFVLPSNKQPFSHGTSIIPFIDLFSEKWDVVFDTSWHHPTMTSVYKKVDADVFIHGHWGGCCYNEPGRFLDKKHVIVSPLQQTTDDIGKCEGHEHYLLPIPIMAPIIKNDFQKKAMTWGIRECFYRRNPVPDIDRASELLDAAVEVSNDMEEFYVSRIEHVANHQEVDEHVSKRNIEILKRTKSKLLAVPERFPHDAFVSILSRSFLTVRNGNPPGAPMDLEGWATRSLPLAWDWQSICKDVYADAGLLLHRGYSRDVIVGTMKSLAFDTSARDFIQGRMLEKLRVHYEHENTLKAMNTIHEIVTRK